MKQLYNLWSMLLSGANHISKWKMALTLPLTIMFFSLSNVVNSQTFSPTTGATNVVVKPVITVTFPEGTVLTFIKSSSVYIEDVNDEDSYIELSVSSKTKPDSRMSINGSSLIIDLTQGAEELNPNTTYKVYTYNKLI